MRCASFLTLLVFHFTTPIYSEQTYITLILIAEGGKQEEGVGGEAKEKMNARFGYFCQNFMGTKSLEPEGNNKALKYKKQYITYHLLIPTETTMPNKIDDGMGL